MRKFRILLLVLFVGFFCFSQQTEREHRIRKSQFPIIQTDLMMIAPHIRKKRYYKEIDSLATSYILKFKKDKLDYFLTYDDLGNLKTSGFRVKEIDLPMETFQKIQAYLAHSYEKYRIKRILQQYPPRTNDHVESTLKDTFQNLILPSNVYRLIIIGKNDGKNTEYDLWFSADGDLIRKRRTLPMNHDRVLY